MSVIEEEKLMDFRQKIALSFMLYIVSGSVAFAQVVDIPDPNLEQAIRDQLNLHANSPVLHSHMRRLTHLHAWERDIEDLTGLEHAPNLRFVYLTSNPIANLDSLTDLGLIKLDLGNCNISDVSLLSGLTTLKSLRLYRNRIKDVSPLANLTNLTELWLQHNRIVDVRPLAALTRLESLNLQNNRIVDHSPLDGLSLNHFAYDQICDMPAIPLQPRLTERNFPSIVAAWDGRLLNRPDLPEVEQITRHDLYFDAWFGLTFLHTEHGVSMAGHLEQAIRERDQFLALNPNMVFLIAVNFRDAYAAADLSYTSPYAPYWVRDADGNPVVGWRDSYLVDFTHSGAQDLVVDRAVAVSKCGLYDGVFLDWWSENGSVLNGYRTVAEEVRAKETIVRRIREETRPGFLIQVNNNRRKFPITAKYINGTFMESGTPGGFSGVPARGELLERQINEVESTLRWAEENLREPQINALEAWAIPTEPLDSPTNLRWMRAFTTLSLTFSDGYVLIVNRVGPDNPFGGHRHYWYDFWDADLGRPVSEKGQLYQETEGLYIREFTNGWAVYNRSGSPQAVTLSEEVQSVSNGSVGTEHVLPDLDGEIYLRAALKNPADVNGDGVVNIFDLTLVAQAIGTDGAGGDVNGDGVVNVFDLVFVAGEMQ